MEDLIKLIRNFNNKRDWDKFHSPKNLAISISIESGELLEHFQWNDIDSNKLMKDDKKLGEIKDELADIFIYSLNLADKLHINVKKAIIEKIDKNSKKYPVNKAKGSSEKYTNL